MNLLILEGPSCTGKTTAATLAHQALTLATDLPMDSYPMHSDEHDAANNFYRLRQRVRSSEYPHCLRDTVVMDRCFLSNVYPGSHRHAPDYCTWAERVAFWTDMLKVDHVACLIALPKSTIWDTRRAEKAAVKQTNGLAMDAADERKMWLKQLHTLQGPFHAYDSIKDTRSFGVHVITQADASIPEYGSCRNSRVTPEMALAVRVAAAALPDWTTPTLLTSWHIEPKPAEREGRKPFKIYPEYLNNARVEDLIWT